MDATMIEAGDRRARANVARLAAAQALAGANASVVFATGAILGAMMAPEKSLATAPVSVFVVGMAFGTLPVGAISRRYGRRAAFYVGSLAGVLCGLIAATAILYNSFWLYCFATFFGGFYAAVSQSYRFAATDGASAGFRAKAISWVMAGGVIAGFIGPQLVQNTMNLWQPYLFAATYIGQAAVALIAMLVLAGVETPPPPPEAVGSGRPLFEVVRQPLFVVAAICGVVSYALMNLVMTSAPLAMKLCGLTLSDSNLAIQWHVIAMYAPSFFTGSLISRFGAGRIVALGLALEAAAAIVDLSGLSVGHFWTGLILLGVGWNFGFIGASAMVVETHSPLEKNKVQAFNDFLVFGTMALGSFSSGKLLTDYGWDMVNYVVFPPVALAMTALALRAWKLRAAAT